MKSPSEAAMVRKTEDLLQLSGTLLAEINREIDRRAADLDPDLRALLVQKGALTQCVVREMGMLLEQSHARFGEVEKLLDLFGHWLEDFFVPLRDQSDGKDLAKPIYLADLEKMIIEIQAVLAKRLPRDGNA